MGGIVMTNDGNAILREIQVQHPAAKSMIEISRAQDEEVGDGTTSVVILGEHFFILVLSCNIHVSKCFCASGLSFKLNQVQLNSSKSCFSQLIDQLSRLHGIAQSRLALELVGSLLMYQIDSPNLCIKSN